MSFTAESWFAKECEDQIEYYTSNEKAKRASNPKESDFISTEEYEKALEKCVRLCDDKVHQGERLLPYTTEYFYGEKGLPNGNCKACKKFKQAEKRRQVAKEKADSLVGRFKTAEDWQKFNTDNFENNMKHVKPVESDFESKVEYEKALIIEKERRINGGEGRKSLREYYEKDKKKRDANKIVKDEAIIEKEAESKYFFKN